MASASPSAAGCSLAVALVWPGTGPCSLVNAEHLFEIPDQGPDGARFTLVIRGRLFLVAAHVHLQLQKLAVDQSIEAAEHRLGRSLRAGLQFLARRPTFAAWQAPSPASVRRHFRLRFPRASACRRNTPRVSAAVLHRSASASKTQNFQKVATWGVCVATSNCRVIQQTYSNIVTLSTPNIVFLHEKSFLYF